jgi:hypothetical protein
VINRELGRSRSGNFLVIWDHYRVAPDFFLIPANEVGNYFYNLLKKANGWYIHERSVSPDVHRVRDFLYGDGEERSARWRVLLEDLTENHQIIGIFHTGQTG